MTLQPSILAGAISNEEKVQKGVGREFCIDNICSGIIPVQLSIVVTLCIMPVQPSVLIINQPRGWLQRKPGSGGEQTQPLYSWLRNPHCVAMQPCSPSRTMCLHHLPVYGEYRWFVENWRSRKIVTFWPTIRRTVSSVDFSCIRTSGSVVYLNRIVITKPSTFALNHMYRSVPSKHPWVLGTHGWAKKTGVGAFAEKPLV